MKKDRENPSVEALTLFFLAEKQLSACQEKKGDLEGLDRNEIVQFWSLLKLLPVPANSKLKLGVVKRHSKANVTAG